MPRSKIQHYSNFSRAVRDKTFGFRPDNESELKALFDQTSHTPLLARGYGLSYNDSCFNKNGIIDMTRLNHFLQFDKKTGEIVCQSGVTFADIFSLDADWIPPVIPGTLYASIGGAIAHDVHGKNNHKQGSFGHHINWIDLRIGQRTFRCSLEHYPELFKATIGGVGLTGIIERVSFNLRSATHYVQKKIERPRDMADLLCQMTSHGMEHDYQAAWLDCLHTTFRSILLYGDHITAPVSTPNIPYQRYHMPRLPLQIIYPSTMKLLNHYYYHHANDNPIIPLWKFNNPLDTVRHWNYAYGKRGLLQFQTVFNTHDAEKTLSTIISIIRQHQAHPILTVLKYFSQPSFGLLSFPQPGFTIAIDFMNNNRSKQALHALNQYITDIQGKIYLAKDLYLTRDQFEKMYPTHTTYHTIIKQYQSSLSSKLGQRLGMVL